MIAVWVYAVRSKLGRNDKPAFSSFQQQPFPKQVVDGVGWSNDARYIATCDEKPPAPSRVRHTMPQEIIALSCRRQSFPASPFVSGGAWMLCVDCV